MVTQAAHVPVGYAATTSRRFGFHRVRLAFRAWRRTRPFWAGLWTILGATLITYVPGTAYRFIFATTSIALGIAVGALIGLLGVLLWVHRVGRTFYGIVIILLSLVSFMTSDFGGLFLGMFMSIIGGSLALSWVPKGYQSRRQRRSIARVDAAGPGPEAVSDTDSDMTLLLLGEGTERPAPTHLIAAEKTPRRSALWHRHHGRHGR